MSAPSTVPMPKDSIGEEDENSSYLEDQKSLGEIQDRVDEYIAVNELENQFETKLTDEGLLVTIRDSILFSPGSAEIATGIYTGLQMILQNCLSLIRRVKSLSRVIRTIFRFRNAQFESNWDLSVMRAVNFLKIIVKMKKSILCYSVQKGMASSNQLNRMIQQKAEVKTDG